VDLAGGIVSVGEYYAIINLGGQPFHVQVDTGSGLTAVPSVRCPSCKEGDHRYDVAKSASGRLVACSDKKCSSSCPRGDGADESMCPFQLRYADGSGGSGEMAYDDLGFEGGSDADDLVKVWFGTFTSDSPDFERVSVDGIMGLYNKKDSCNPSCVPTVFQSFVDDRHLPNLFTICMSQSGGKMVWGSADTDLVKGGFKYSYLDSTSMFYSVAIEKEQIKFGDKVFSNTWLSSGIVDTGTTLVVLPTGVFNEIATEFKANYCDVPATCEDDSWVVAGGCASLSDADIAKLPVFRIELKGGVELELTADEYMLRYTQNEVQYRCFGFMPMGNSVILGNTLMQKYTTVYDRKEHRVGFGLTKNECK